MAYGEEKIANVVGDVYGEAHVCKVEAVAAPDECNGDDVVSNKFFKVLSRLLQHKHQDQRLLNPIRRLQQIVRLEKPLVFPMRESVKHAVAIEIPHRRPTHHVQPKGSKDGKVHCGVSLFHET